MEDGNIEFLGRDDEQIKVRGYRVEIGEIKNVVLQHKEIREAIVIPDKTDRHNIKIILFITTYNSLKPDVREFKSELRQNLPEYMIPSDIVHYKEFPASDNGKIDTKKLMSEYLRSLTVIQEEFLLKQSEKVELTMTSTQFKIYKIWSEALSETNISLTDNFFDVGGNSMSAVSVFSKMNSEFNINLGLKIFFDSPRISDMAETIDIATRKLKKEDVVYKLEKNESRIVSGEI